MDFKNVIKLCEDLDIPLLLDVYLDLYEYRMAENNSFNFLTYISRIRLVTIRYWHVPFVSQIQPVVTFGPFVAC